MKNIFFIIHHWQYKLNTMFVFLLVFVVLLVGALSFFPALALGPVAEHLQMAR